MKPRPISPPPAPSSSALRGYLARATSFVLLISLSYALGFLSASSSSSSYSSSSPSPPTRLNLQSGDAQSINLTARPIPTPTLKAKAAAETSSSSLPPHDLLRFRTRCAAPIPQSETLRTIIDRVFDGDDPFAGFPAPDTAALLLAPAARPRGWGSRGAVFRDLMASVRPRTVIELGAFLGASALHMAALARNLSFAPPPLILCVDDFRGWPGFRRRFRRDVPRARHADALLLQQFMANVAAGAAGAGSGGASVVPVPFSTGSALEALCEWGVYGDLIEVDAGHDFHSAWADINRAYAVLRPGGVLFGHDYFTAADDRGVRRAVTLFAQVKGLKVRPHGEHWVLSPKPNSDDY
ncbi:hypothetical protein ACMD2_26038 [Ananas comosus]|uniref:Uncharacterized protein n=1 Tax=Ananas comosus TaxID=4615 RepID=A0A199VGZ7_ANACO|nr:hypothetical protein ACMD2_26038 [Ananas comosus]